MDVAALSMRERLDAVHGDILALFAEENTIDSLLGDLDPQTSAGVKHEGGPKWPNRDLRRVNAVGWI